MSFFRRRKQELNEEIESHVRMAAEDRVARGEPRSEAEQAAQREFGNAALVHEATRDQWGWRWLETLLQDVRYAMRTLRKSPGFTIVAVLTLALGIGANAAIFSVVNSVLLKSLPYPHSDQLVMVFLSDQALGIKQGGFGNADFIALHQEQQSFAAVAALSAPDNGFTLTGAGEAVPITGSAVTADFFSVLTAAPVLGRTFLPKDGESESPDTVVVSYPFWKEHLGGDSAAVGRNITLDQKSYTVIGVMPPEFRFGRLVEDQVWPILKVFDIGQRPPYFLFVIGRRKPGVSNANAAADETRIAKDVERKYPVSGEKAGNVVTMKEFFVGDSSTALLVLLGAVGLVLLIAVVNVANLQIARGAVRQREMAIRAALGAGWLRLAVQLLTECLCIGLIGGALGLWLAYRGLSAILAISPQISRQILHVESVTVDGRVLAFTAAVALLASILFGLVPIFSMRNPQLDESLKQSGRSGNEGAGSRFTHSVLVVSEFSLALVLLAGAGLLLRSLAQLEAVSPGFQAGHIVATQIKLPKQRYSRPEQVTSFYQQLLDRVGSEPGVEAAGLTMSAPPNLLEVMNPFHIEGQPYTKGKSAALAEEIPVSESYFRTLGIPLVSGRYFDESDRLPSKHSLVINSTMAKNYFPGVDPVGHRLQTGDAHPSSTWSTIVGVVGDVKYEGLGEKDQPTMYVPVYDDGWNPWFTRSMFLMVRTPAGAGSVASQLREILASLDRDVPLLKVQTMDDLLSQSVGEPRLWTVLLSTFAGLALFLAAIGIYGVLAYTVTQQRHEIGIRMTLGAQRGDVLRLVLKRGALLALLGIAIGIAAASLLTRLMRSLLFGISATDPLTFGGVALVLLGVAIVACYIPARRATRVDPLVALRYE